MCPCEFPRVCVFEEDVYQKRDQKRKESTKRKKSETYSTKLTNRQIDGLTDRHKSFFDMRYNTVQHDKSNSIEQNRIQLNQFEIKLN